jgi:tetratricopeptide (TPR) repeat protein
MSRLLVVLLIFAGNLSGQAPGPVPGQEAIGNDHFSQSRYAEAIAAYEKLPQAERTSPVLNRLAVSYHMLSRFKEAETTYKAAIRIAPDDSNTRNNLASLYYSQRKFSDAEREFRRALEREPENPAMRRNLRAAKYARENGRKARDVATAVAAEKPLLVSERLTEILQIVLLVPPQELETATTHEKRGDSFLARKMFDDAIIEYRRSIAVDRYNAVIVNRLGIAYHQNQKLNEAERQYREALKLNPYYVEALNNLGSVEYSRQEYDRALSQYNKALKIQPDSATILQNIAGCLFAMERYEEGAQMYQRALQINPKLFEPPSGGAGTLVQAIQRADPMQQFHLAKIFAGNGDKERALSYLYRAIEEGFRDLDMIRQEPVFSILAEDERFVQLMASSR